MSRSNGSSGLVKKRWTPPEDMQLRKLVNKNGYNWTRIAVFLPGRAAKQCRERWLNHLDPKIRKGKLSDGEWAKIQLAHRSCGNSPRSRFARWTKIAQLLPGRSPNQIKNYWHARTRKNKNKLKHVVLKAEGEVSSTNEDPSSLSGSYDDYNLVKMEESTQNTGSTKSKRKKREDMSINTTNHAEYIVESPSLSPSDDMQVVDPFTTSNSNTAKFDALVRVASMLV